MSRFQTFTVSAGIAPPLVGIRRKDALVKALGDLGFKEVEVYRKPNCLYGYQGDKRTETAEVIVRREHIGTLSNDIGFKRGNDGTFQAIISEYDRTKYSETWLQDLADRYAYHVRKGGLFTQSKRASKADQAYAKRIKQEQDAHAKRIQKVKQTIAQIKSQASTKASDQSHVKVQLSTNNLQSTHQSLANRDEERRIKALKSRLPAIKAEYKSLVDGLLLDSDTVSQAFQNVSQALNAKALTTAELQLQALDDARIEATQQKHYQTQSQLVYVQKRLDSLKNRLPQIIVENLQAQINQANKVWQKFSESDLQALHQQINEFEAQTERIQTAAVDLANSWIAKDFEASVIPATSDGDVLVEIKTHQGANTLMRLKFDGEQIDFEGPPEKSNACTTRPIEAMRIFQEQGYRVDWTEIDHQPVAEELKAQISCEEPMTKETTQGTINETSTPHQPKRRRKAQKH